MFKCRQGIEYLLVMSSSMASISRVLLVPMMMMVVMLVDVAVVVKGNWCVARSDASIKSLQTALDYACGAGADCTPIQTNGLCFLPNTIYAHASYAFNSYFQRRSMAPGSCDFSSTATVATTDPSYGSCVYPSSLSTAGGAAPGTGSNNPYTVPAPPFVGGVGTGTGLTPGTGTRTPSLPTENSNSEATTTFVGFWFAFAVPTTFTAFCLLLLDY